MPDNNVSVPSPTGTGAEAAQPTTVILAWTDPSIADHEIATFAGQALLQCLAKVLAYVRASAGTERADLWRQALSHLPLLGTGGLANATTTSTDLRGLQQQAAETVADSVGASTSSAAVVGKLIGGPPHDGGTVNVVQTAVAGTGTGVNATICQDVLVYSVAPSRSPVGPRQSWTLAQTSTQMPFDYQSLLTDKRIRQQWDQFMQGLDVSIVTALPTFHSLELRARPT
jgi:hypothetical protein